MWNSYRFYIKDTQTYSLSVCIHIACRSFHVANFSTSKYPKHSIVITGQCTDGFLECTHMLPPKPLQNSHNAFLSIVKSTVPYFCSTTTFEYIKCVLSWLLGGESCLLVMCMVQVKLVMDLNKFKTAEQGRIGTAKGCPTACFYPWPTNRDIWLYSVCGCVSGDVA